MKRRKTATSDHLRDGHRASTAALRSGLAAGALLLLTAVGGQSLAQGVVSQGATGQGAAGQGAATQDGDRGLEFPEVVARIDDYTITRGELLAHAEIVRLNALQGGGADPAGSLVFYRQVLDALIGERLMYADLERRGAVVGDAEVERAFQAMVEQRGGREAFEAAMQAQRISLDALRRQLRQNLTIERLLTRDIASQVRPTEQELRRFYDSNLDRMWKPERHRVRHILKRVSLMTSEDGKEKIHAQLLALRQQAANGADFADLAADHSEDADSRAKGGELPWVIIVEPQGDAFAEAVVGLATVGQMSDIVETPQGLHLIQLMGREPTKLRTFEEAKAEIAGILTTTRVKQQVLQRVAELRSKARIEVLI